MASKNKPQFVPQAAEPDDLDREILAFKSAPYIANLLQIPIVTANRWKRHKRLPPMARRLLEILADGKLESLHSAWKGWCLIRGELVSPENEVFSPSQVRAGRYWKDAAKDHSDRVQLLRAELEELRGLVAEAKKQLANAEAEIEKIVNAAPVRVQLVAIDADGRQTALTAPVAPLVRVAQLWGGAAENAAPRAAG